jgi:hypothetical protein
MRNAAAVNIPTAPLLELYATTPQGKPKEALVPLKSAAAAAAM